MEMADHSEKEVVQSKYGMYRESLTSPEHTHSEETLLIAADDAQNQKTAGCGTPVLEVERHTSSRFSKISLEDIPGSFASQSERRTTASSDDSGIWNGEDGITSPDIAGIHSEHVDASMSLCDASEPPQLGVNDEQKNILTTRVPRVEDERAQLEDDRRYLEESRARFEQEVGVFEQIRAEHSRRISHEADAHRSEEESIRAREQHLADEQARILDEKRNIEEERQGLLEDMKELQLRLDAKAGLERRERAVLEREQHLQAHMGTDSSLLEKFAEAKIQLDQATEKNGHLEQELAELKRVMNDMKEQSEEQRRIMGELTEQNESLKASKGPSSQSLSRQKSKIKTLEQAVKNERQRSDKVERELDVANSRLEKLQDKIDDLDLANEVLETDVESLKREVSTWQGNCDALNHQLQTTEEKMQTWKSAYLIADGDRKELKVAHDSLIDDLKKLSQRLAHETKEKDRLRAMVQSNNNSATSSNANAFHAVAEDVILIDVDMSQGTANFQTFRQ